MKATPAPKLTPRLKWLLSALVVLHLAAVFMPPLAFQTRGPLGSSPSIEMLLEPVRRYGEFLYLNRGYAFFAPDPGPSHLFQAAITSPAKVVTEPIYPDLKRHWPRLLYHRHFMLAEFLNDAYRPPVPEERPEDLTAQEYRFWVAERSRYEAIRDSLIDHLRATHPGHEVAIRRLEHSIPSFIEFNEDPVPLDDLRLYNVLLDPSDDSPAEDDEPISLFDDDPGAGSVPPTNMGIRNGEPRAPVRSEPR